MGGIGHFLNYDPLEAIISRELGGRLTFQVSPGSTEVKARGQRRRRMECLRVESEEEIVSGGSGTLGAETHFYYELITSQPTRHSFFLTLSLGDEELMLWQIIIHGGNEATRISPVLAWYIIAVLWGSAFGECSEGNYIHNREDDTSNGRCYFGGWVAPRQTSSQSDAGKRKRERPRAKSFRPSHLTRTFSTHDVIKTIFLNATTN